MTRRFQLLSVTAAVFAVAAGAAWCVRTPSPRVLAATSETAIRRAFEGMRPSVVYKTISIQRDRISSELCPASGACFRVQLRAPTLLCLGHRAGPFCLHVEQGDPSSASLETVLSRLREVDGTVWAELPPPPPPPPGPRRFDEARAWWSRVAPRLAPGAHRFVHISRALLILIILLAGPLASGAVVGTLLRRRWRFAGAVSLLLFAACPPVIAMLIGTNAWSGLLEGLLCSAGLLWCGHEASSRPGRIRYATSLFVVTLVIVEIVVRFVAWLPSVKDRVQHLGERGRAVWALENYSLTSDEPWLDRKPMMPHPRWGWTNRPGEYRGQEGLLKINSLGLRSPDDTSAEKPAGRTRVEVFGDSFAYGAEVDESSTLGAQLERAAPNLEVLNFAVPGYGLDQALLRFREQGTALHADVVVICLLNLLATRCADHFSSWYKPYFVTDGTGLVLHGIPVQSPGDALAAYERRLRIVDAFGLAFAQVRPEPDVTRVARQLLHQFVDEIRRSGARPVVVLAPTPSEYQSSAEISPGGLAFQEVCSAGGVECVNTLPAFQRADAAGEKLTTGVHWSPAGHQLVAAALAARLAPVATR